MYWTHFKTDKTEKLLKKLASYNNILIQPRRYSYCTADSRKITSSYATFVTLIDQILTRMEYIDALYSTRELQEIFIDISVQKYESRKLYDKEDNSVWDFGAFIPQMNEEIFEPSSKEETIGALEGETVQEIDVDNHNYFIFIVNISKPFMYICNLCIIRCYRVVKYKSKSWWIDSWRSHRPRKRYRKEKRRSERIGKMTWLPP